MSFCLQTILWLDGEKIVQSSGVICEWCGALFMYRFPYDQRDKIRSEYEKDVLAHKECCPMKKS